jgi:hypothetical protein
LPAVHGAFRLRLEGASTLGGSVPEQLLRSHSSYLNDRRHISGIENYGAVIDTQKALEDGTSVYPLLFSKQQNPPCGGRG